MQPGVVLAGKYRLERVLGEGATGIVWAATQLELARPVALKLMHKVLAGQRDAQARFLREARVAASFHHPGAVRILDFGDAELGMFLVMELLSGQTLRARLDREVLPRPLALELAAQIAGVLDAAHQINLVHRDIKPENTFLIGDDQAPRIKVVDFGLAFIADDHTSLGRLTADGVLGGTPAYMSPEQARGRAVGPASDVYSLGCTLYEMIAGRPPFIGSVTETITRHAFTPPLSMVELGVEPPVAPALDQLVRTMLGKSPPLRPTAAQVAIALDAIARDAADDGDSRALRKGPRTSRSSLPVVAAAPDLEPDETERVIAIDGPVDDELRLALAAAHIEIADAADPRVTAVFAPGASLDRLGSLVATGRAVITDVDAGDFAGMAARVRAGCHAAVARPVVAAQLIARLRRVPVGAAPTPSPPHA